MTGTEVLQEVEGFGSEHNIGIHWLPIYTLNTLYTIIKYLLYKYITRQFVTNCWLGISRGKAARETEKRFDFEHWSVNVKRVRLRVMAVPVVNCTTQLAHTVEIGRGTTQQRLNQIISPEKLLGMSSWLRDRCFLDINLSYSHNQRRAWNGDNGW